MWRVYDLGCGEEKILSCEIVSSRCIVEERKAE